MFATSSRNDVRVWHAATGKELLRIEVANLQCNAVEITPDARAIITGQSVTTSISALIFKFLSVLLDCQNLILQITHTSYHKRFCRTTRPL